VIVTEDTDPRRETLLHFLPPSILLPTPLSASVCASLACKPFQAQGCGKSQTRDNIDTRKIHTYIYACMHTYIRTYMHTHIHTGKQSPKGRVHEVVKTAKSISRYLNQSQCRRYLNQSQCRRYLNQSQLVDTFDSLVVCSFVQG
jgi:hypothetical protein